MASNDEQRSATTIFTTAAQSIAARLIANKTTAKFTKAEISTTNLFNQSVTELQVLTSLDNVQQTADINTVTVINDSTVDVNIAIDQTKAPNDYQMNSVGLFAVDGDGKEVLYSVTVLKDPVYIHQDAMGSALGIDLETVVGQSSNVDLSINPAGAVTNEALKVTLADYVKTDDVEKLIPATVIDGSKPADFKEAVTLEKGAVDGAGNAIATAKDLADGDAETLKSAKDYADTKISGKADDSKVVHTADMRKPASDVASIDEVNAKQDKIGYTPADDSKVFHSTVTQLNSTDMNTVLTAGFYKLNSVTNGMPNADDHTIYQVINYYSSNGVQIAYGTNNIILGMRSWYSYRNFTSWVQFADDSKVAHLSGNEEIGGQKTFDTAPVDKTTGNPYITKSDVATAVSAVNANVVDRNPDTGVVSEPVDFTNAKVNGHSIVPIETSTDKDTAQADSATTPNVIYLY